MRGSRALRNVTNLRLFRLVEMILPMTMFVMTTSVASVLMGRQAGGCVLVGTLLFLLWVGFSPKRPRREFADSSDSIWKRPLEDCRWGHYIWIPFVMLMIGASLIISVNVWIVTFGISAGPTAAACVVIASIVFRPRRQRPPYQAPPDNREGAGCPVRPITRRPLAGGNRARTPR